MSCPDCFKGTVHNHGEPEGHIEKIHGYDTYVAGPDSRAAASQTSKSTILFITDAFGLKLVNNKLLADRYAKDTGHRVLVPDIIRGGGAPVRLMTLLEDLLRPMGNSWLNPFTWFFKAKTFVEVLFHAVPFMMRARPPTGLPDCLRYARALKAEMKANPGARLGAAGFCWGGYSSTNLASEPAVEGGTTPLLDASFQAHPSALKLPDDVIRAVTTYRVPYSVAVAEHDMMLDATKAEQIEAELRRKVGSPSAGAGETNYEFIVHKGCRHSFAVRANPDFPSEKQGYEDATKQAIAWFKKYL